MNVAVSRAREQFVLVADRADCEGSSLLADLVRYIGYHDEHAIGRSRIRSIFELLSTAHADALAQVRASRGRRAQRESAAESIAADTLDRVLAEDGHALLRYVQEHPLLELVGHLPDLMDEERQLAENGSRVDFLVYDSLSKQPVLVIEVDGSTYHPPGSRQAARDALKDSALAKAGLDVLRLRTEGSQEPERIREALHRAQSRH